ncbi:MAG: periplasmic heavy metal sensor [Acidobacteria bacterium]|nr:periplasmic heavy metal sensor [Acidobacteriota bacterium]
MSILLALLQGPASLQAPPPPPPPPFPLLDPRLGLDPDQRQALEALLASHRDALHARHEAWEEARKALREALSDPTRTTADLEAPLAREAEAHRAQALAAHALLVEAAKVLRPEQRQAAARLKPAFPPEGPRGPRSKGGPDGRPEPRR